MSTNEFSHLSVTKAGGVARVELARPDVHNAMNGVMIEELGTAFRDLGSDADVRVIVLSGQGRSFCAGADLAWMRAAGEAGGDANHQNGLRIGSLFATVQRCPKPVVGRIHGVALGGGGGLVAACDIPIALASTKFGFTEVRLGIAPAVISPIVVGRIGVTHARELFVTGERFDGHRAHHIGLINHVVDDMEALDAAVDRVVGNILKGGPNAVSACKELALTVMDLPRETVAEQTANLIARLRAGGEGQEGMQAFLERRKPYWITGEGS